MTHCPFCNEPLAGLATYCWNCQRYTDVADPKPKGKKAKALKELRRVA